MNDEIKEIYFEQIDSTNTWAKNHWLEWLSNGVTLIVANEQIKGRGRFNREWKSPKSVNIYATFCFWVDENRHDIGNIPQILAIQIVQLLQKKGLHSSIKWPNDILASGKKIAGILCETIVRENKKGVICGVGINVNMTEGMLKEIDRPCTSLLMETGQAFHSKELLDELKKMFKCSLNTFLLEKFDSFYEDYQKFFNLKKGDPITFLNDEKIFHGFFDSVLSDGSIKILIEKDIFKILHSGEIID
ncbi:MAG: biotin--[acetyl-CoA-carboxylase] ligase [Parachlamydiaceae bacterium]|nr:biotin--[acetyl-CoA-carboxylase] ligase [Parachlamydiaceae bacterium]